MARENLLFTEQEWEASAAKVTRGMNEYLADFCTPIVKHLGDYGALEGTGTYLSFAGRTFILTNEHVARIRNTKLLLLHLLSNKEDLQPIRGNHMANEEPLDVALLPVDSAAWSARDHRSRAVTMDRISPKHEPAVTELLIFSGFAGERHSFRFGTIITPATTSASREVTLPMNDARFKSEYHFGLDYNPNLATSVVGSAHLPIPNGMSGSLVWNSRLVECKISGTPWTPEQACVTGLIFGWPSNVGCLVALRAEYLIEALNDASANIRSGSLDNP